MTRKVVGRRPARSPVFGSRGSVGPTGASSVAGAFKLANRPHVVRDADRHGRRDPQRFVHPAKVVVPDVQTDRPVVVAQLLAVGIGQPGHAPNPHAQRQVLSFNERRADLLRGWVAGDDPRLNAGDCSRVGSWGT